MKYLRKFNEALSESELSKIEEEVLKLFPHLRGHVTINPQDGTIDVHNELFIFLGREKFTGTKLPFKFGHIANQFFIQEVPLTTLEGCPHTTERFAILNTQVTDLVGGPQSVEAYSIGSCNNLVSLKGLSHTLNSLSIKWCPVTSLEGCPSYIGSYFSIEHLHITDLVGGPKEVDGICNISGHTITSLEGIPTRVEFLYFNCPNVWDPSPLRNVKILSDDLMRIEGPLKYLIGFFCLIFDGAIDDDGIFFKGDWWDKFRESLDYNYVRQRGGKWEINHFRFLEALAEFDFEPNNIDSRIKEFTSIGPYFFIDEKENRVNLMGDRIPNNDQWDSFLEDEYDEDEDYDEDYDDYEDDYEDD